MKYLFTATFIALFLLSSACSKISDHDRQRDGFFDNPDQVAVLVKNTISQLKLGYAFTSIERISYLHSGKEDYAVVFYSTTKGSQNLVVKKEVGATLAAASVTVCRDGNCDCMVRVRLHNDGTVDVDCSCSSCTKVTTYASFH